MFVSVRVRGVFFRSETKCSADSCGVNGWVSTLPDTSVEAVFEGEEGAVETLVEFCESEPSGARVANVDLTWETCTEEFGGFKRKPELQFRAYSSHICSRTIFERLKA